MSSYNNTHSNEFKENQDENIKKLSVGFEEKNNSKNKNKLSLFLNKISIPNNRGSNIQTFLNQKNLNNLIKLNTIES
jgi:hypothetical protein